MPAVEVGTFSSTETRQALFSQSRNIKRGFVLFWTAFWLYLSLGMVIISFSAIQFQMTISDEARREALSAGNKTSGSISVALIQLKHEHYQNNLDQLKKLQETGHTDDTSKLSVDTLTHDLVLALFKPGEPIPDKIIDELLSRCKKPDATPQVATDCAAYAKATSSNNAGYPGSVAPAVIPNTNEIQLASDVRDYEGSLAYSEAADLDGHKKISAFIFPWMPIVLPTLPHPVLVLLVTISMGALGSVLFMLQLHFKTQSSVTAYPETISWYFFRPIQGMATALAIFLLVKAGQLTVSGGDTIAGDTSELNVFVLGFLGVVSGLLSDRAVERLSAAGIELLRLSAADGAHRGAPENETTKETRPADSKAAPEVPKDADENQKDVLEDAALGGDGGAVEIGASRPVKADASIFLPETAGPTDQVNVDGSNARSGADYEITRS